jgi:hypothetical protein
MRALAVEQAFKPNEVTSFVTQALQTLPPPLGTRGGERDLLERAFAATTRETDRFRTCCTASPAR